MIKDVDGFLLTDLLNRKNIVKVTPFPSAKTSDMEYYATPSKKDFDPAIYILHVYQHDLALNGTPEEIPECIVNITTSLKTENGTVVITRIMTRGDGNKETVYKLLVGTCVQN